MKLLLTTALALSIGACASGDGRPDSGTHRYVGQPGIEKLIDLQDDRIHFSDTDLAIYQVDILNISRRDVTCEVRPRWFDATGLEADSAVRTWQVKFIPAGSRTPVKSVAPTLDAVRCELEVRLHQPLED